MASQVRGFLSSCVPTMETCTRVAAAVTGAALLAPVYHGAVTAVKAAANFGFNCLPMPSFAVNMLHNVAQWKPLFDRTQAAESCFASARDAADVTALEICTTLVSLYLLKRAHKHIQHSRTLPALPAGAQLPAPPTGDYTKLARWAFLVANVERGTKLITGAYLLGPAYRALLSTLKVALDTQVTYGHIPAYAWEYIRPIRRMTVLLDLSPAASSFMAREAANTGIATMATCTALIACYLLYHNFNRAAPDTVSGAEQQSASAAPDDAAAAALHSPRTRQSFLDHEEKGDQRATLVRPTEPVKRSFAVLKDTLELYKGKIYKPAAKKGTGNVTSTG